MKYFSFLFILVLSLTSLAQNNVTIPSPNATSLGQFGLTPVNLSNGMALVTVPIFAEKYQGLDFDINLRYATGGIQVNQLPTWVGLGWDLNCAGSITRIIKGEADDKYPNQPSNAPNNRPWLKDLTPTWGYYYIKHRLNRNDWSEPSVLSAINSPLSTDSTYGYIMDYEPDEFLFSFGKHSGKFYMNHLGEWKVYSDFPDNYKVEVQLVENYKLWRFSCKRPEALEPWMHAKIRSVFLGFTITTGDGVKYIFGGDSSCVEFSRPPIDKLQIDDDGSIAFECWNQTVVNRGINASTWQLKQIVFPGGHTVNYTYERGNEIITRMTNAYLYLSKTREQPSWNSNISGDERNSHLKAIFNLINPVYLKSIDCEKFKITFNTTDVKDLPTHIENDISKNRFECYDDYDYGMPGCSFDLSIQGSRKLDSIVVLDFNGQPIKKIGFEYIENSNQRLKLRKVLFCDQNSIAVNSYLFSYNPRLLPAYHSLEIDHWGFYNGFSFFHQPDIFDNLTCEDYGAYYESRSPNLELSQAEILTRVQYPTGGSTTFEYELNSFSKVANLWPDFLVRTINVDSVGGGLRVKKIIDSIDDAAVRNRYFYYVQNYVGGGSKSSGVMGGKTDYIFKNEYQLQGLWKQECSFGSGSIYPLSSTNGSHILYSEVTEREIGNGFAVHTFSNHDNGFKDNFPISGVFTYNGALTGSTLRSPFASMSRERGKEIQLDIYDEGNKILQRTINEYNIDPSRLTSYVRSVSRSRNESSTLFTGSGLIPIVTSSALGPHNTIAYQQYYFPANISKAITIQYANLDSLKTENMFYYDYSRSNNLVRTEMITSKGDTIKIFNYYPYDYSSPVYGDMISKFMTGIKVGQSTFKNSKHLKSIKTNYFNWSPEIYAPESVEERQETRPFETKTRYYGYDAKSNILSMSKENDMKLSYVWAYQKNYPVAIATNASQNEIFFDGFEEINSWNGVVYDNTRSHTGSSSARIDKPDVGKLAWQSRYWLSVQLSAKKKFKYSGWIYSNVPSAELVLLMKNPGETNAFTYSDAISNIVTGKWVYLEKEFEVPISVTQLNIRIDNNGGGSVWFDDIRLHPSDAQMTTYTYSPLIGMTSETDGRNVTIYYEYDQFGRLDLIKDLDGNIIKKYCYNYRGEKVECGAYGNDAMRKAFIRDNCATNYEGEELYYSLPAGVFVSYINKADANKLALANIISNGQKDVNQNGACKLVLFARLEYQNYNYHTIEESPDEKLEEVRADMYVRFYYDAACTQPASAVNLELKANLDFDALQNGGGGQELVEVTCNGIAQLVEYSVAIMQQSSQRNSATGNWQVINEKKYYHGLQASRFIHIALPFSL